MKTVSRDFLKESGIIFQINRHILHPLGFCISAEGDTLVVEDHSDENPAGLKFSDQEFERGSALFLEYMREYGLRRMKLRVEKFGFIVQGEMAGMKK